MGNESVYLDFDLNDNGHVDPFIKDEANLGLQELIPRILQERKHFVNITEKALVDEIESLETSKSVDKSSDAVDESKLTPIGAQDATEDTIQEKFNIQKFELTRNINNALNETSLSLDFVSLLVASVKPNIAKNTMSPHLQKLIKPSSLNSDKLAKEEEETLQKDTARSTKIGHGWKTEAASKITCLFKQSSENLTTQVKKENKYWNMISLVWSNDEALFRMRDPANNARAIGVKYGYGDSGSDFQDKGLALFRKNVQTGEVSFHPLSTSGNNLVAKTYRYVRVRMLSRIDSDFMLTGQSVFDYKCKKSSHDIINEIEMARFFLFEEDLFYQISREAAILFSYNVSATTDKVTIGTENEIIEFENVLYDDANEEELENYYQNVSSLSQYLNDVNDILINLALQYNLDPSPKLDKYTNLDGKTANPFKRSIEIPNSVFSWTIQNQHEKVLNVVIKVTSNEVFVDLITKLTVTRFESMNAYKSNMNGTNVLQNDYFDRNDLQESLEWLICDFTSS
ncbi:SRB4 [Candida margitis]|uniref:SRB4 n=1 Tax=Candida margitis TaxID=1775924 RepID=UPI0022274091|nr:SRB4 [Candida margitis]KAI5961761.1 SRB4 [Candida margitis]